MKVYIVTIDSNWVVSIHKTQKEALEYVNAFFSKEEKLKHSAEISIQEGGDLTGCPICNGNIGESHSTECMFIGKIPSYKPKYFEFTHTSPIKN